MPILKRSLLAQFTLILLVLGLVSFALGWALEELGLEKPFPLLIAIGANTLLVIVFFIWKFARPLFVVTQEMKALLTGKTYRKIMTDKRNEIGVMAYFFNEITRNLEKISGEYKEHRRIKKELDIAQRIQRDLLPTHAPDVPGLEIIAKTKPASEIGGDTFDFFPMKDRTLLYVGDSTGHGIPAGIVMIMVDTLVSTFVELYKEITEIVIQLNHFLRPHLQKTMFMTMVLLEWDHKSTLKWVGAGHEYIIHYKASTSTIQNTPSGGIAVGMLPDNKNLVKEQSLTLEENDFIVLFSDGIVEAKNVLGETYSLARLNKSIQNHASVESSAEEVFNQLAVEVSRFMEGRIQEDDMTLIVIKRTEKKNGPANHDTNWTSEENLEEQKAP